MKLPSIFISAFVLISVLEHQSTKYLLVDVGGRDLGKMKLILNIIKLIYNVYNCILYLVWYLITFFSFYLGKTDVVETRTPKCISTRQCLPGRHCKDGVCIPYGDYPPVRTDDDPFRVLFGKIPQWIHIH